MKKFIHTYVRDGAPSSMEKISLQNDITYTKNLDCVIVTKFYSNLALDRISFMNYLSQLSY